VPPTTPKEARAVGGDVSHGTPLHQRSSACLTTRAPHLSTQTRFGAYRSTSVRLYRPSRRERGSQAAPAPNTSRSATPCRRVLRRASANTWRASLPVSVRQNLAVRHGGRCRLTDVLVPTVGLSRAGEAGWTSRSRPSVLTTCGISCKMTPMALDRKKTVANVRATSGLASGKGPNDDRILEAVGNFVEAFDYWYIRVMREAVPKYRQLIIARINPFVRRIQCDGLDTTETAALIVQDYDSRNSVTAGGWAIEALATGVRPEVRKSGIAGIDLDRFDESTGEYHLYVLKSGLVTRNSDIISALKRNARAAEKQLHQSKTTKGVRANYAIAAGKTTSTFEDGVWRPSSEEFWAEMFDMDDAEQAVDLALAIASEAGRLVSRDASEHLDALRLLVGDYIADRQNDSVVDWDFIARRTMRNKDSWKEEDKERHERALKRLAQTGYAIATTKKKTKP
jgi:hypothetical protein